jgi:hypothetical protein
LKETALAPTTSDFVANIAPVDGLIGSETELLSEQLHDAGGVVVKKNPEQNPGLTGAYSQLYPYKLSGGGPIGPLQITTNLVSANLMLG